ncbi:MAG: hypothetical protein B7Z08_02295 [Sphingomonadales bacterium 32-68-7]|nr:MAG: hypothetical protein B7Z33_03080 [Sphingomonadales bacterium 12-68-11]OYX10077.1 MAG: hypothetical protein B7Z08_02295 [Sphingomonadales bacterium 32-68-7]
MSFGAPSNVRKRFRTAPKTAVAACALTMAIVGLGYVMLGLLPAALFTFGFLGGLLAWFVVPTAASFGEIRTPFFLTLGLFVVHKLEERYLDFFPALSRITGVPVPDTNSILVYLLYGLASTWLLTPWLMKRGHAFGQYLAWTFFVSMGVVELAHFAFPLLTPGSYEYFPGMVSALLLVPAAWWGIRRLARPSTAGPRLLD